ncbi:MAG: Asp-tRNA(Asn)/Glu-tRNA(Gln) amidotransferase subunit GatC [Atribacterota bacterium]
MTEKIIEKKDVEYAANLAKLKLNDQQKKLFLKQLNNILSYFKQLNELDTDNVEPTSYILHTSNLFHEDILKPSLPQETVLSLTEYKKDGYFKVPKIL